MSSLTTKPSASAYCAHARVQGGFKRQVSFSYFLLFFFLFRIPTHFQNPFPYFFDTVSIINEKTTIFIFPKFHSWTRMRKHLQNCHQRWRTKFEKTNGWIWNFGTFSIFYVHFGQIQHFFKVLKSDFTIQYFQYRMEHFSLFYNRISAYFFLPLGP